MQEEKQLVVLIVPLAAPHVFHGSLIFTMHYSYRRLSQTAVIVISLASEQTSRLASQRLFAPSEKEKV